MARSLKYPHRKYLRISDPAQAELSRRVKKSGLAENVLLRQIVERDLIKKGGSDVQVQNTKA